MAQVRELPQKMNSALEKLEYEQAAKYLEYFSALKHVIGKQRLVLSSGKNRNIVAVELINNGLAKLFIFKGNTLIHSEVISLTGKRNELKKYLRQIILDKYVPNKNKQRILSSSEIDEAQIIYSYLRKNKNIVNFNIPFSYLKHEAVKMDPLLEKFTVIIDNRIDWGSSPLIHQSMSLKA
jgi:excinuclease ABC subunit C